jgi:hypothetical protein
VSIGRPVSDNISSYYGEVILNPPSPLQPRRRERGSGRGP